MRKAFVYQLALIALGASFAAAQGPAPFAILTQQSAAALTLSDGGTLPFAADGIGLPSDAGVAVTYRPSNTNYNAVITAVDLSGASDFRLLNLPDLTTPVTLTSATPALAFGVRYKPLTSKAATGKVIVTYSEIDTTNGLNKTLRSGTLSFNLTGVAPELGLTYAVQPSGNGALLSDGASVQLPQTNVNDTTTVVVSIANKGTGAGVVNAVSISGAAQFVLAGVPYLPITVDAGKTAQFSVRFTPTNLDAVSTAVRVDLATGASVGFKVLGSGLGAQFAYAVPGKGGEAPIAPGGTLALPDAVIGGDKTFATIRVTNTGNADGKIAGISLSGAGYSISEAPLMPYMAVAGTSFTVVVAFTPTAPGKSPGRLRIGADDFNLDGNGLGPNLTYNYAAAGGAIGITSGGTVVFAPTSLGGASTVRFTVRNDGTAATEVTSVSVSGAATTFALSPPPALPMKLAPGASATFSMTFTPTATGTNTGTLRIDTQTFTLSGSANAPAALPDYSFQGSSGTVEPQQQPALGLSLSAAYALALNGTLNLTFTSEGYANDPSVQFANGGRSIAFTIPAGSRQAVFPSGATQVRIQTGTVAGSITLSPTFATATGAVDVTPATPATLTLTVPQSAPRIMNVVISSMTGNTLTLYVTGFATGRSVTQMDFQFTPVQGESVGTTKISLNVEPTFAAWYLGASSQAYGSQFTATVPFTLAGDLKNATTQTGAIQSVSVTLTNRQGVSAAKSIDLH